MTIPILPDPALMQADTFLDQEGDGDDAPGKTVVLTPDPNKYHPTNAVIDPLTGRATADMLPDGMGMVVARATPLGVSRAYNPHDPLRPRKILIDPDVPASKGGGFELDMGKVTPEMLQAAERQLATQGLDQGARGLTSARKYAILARMVQEAEGQKQASMSAPSAAQPQAPRMGMLREAVQTPAVPSSPDVRLIMDLPVLGPTAAWYHLIIYEPPGVLVAVFDNRARERKMPFPKLDQPVEIYVPKLALFCTAHLTGIQYTLEERTHYVALLNEARILTAEQQDQLESQLANV